MKPIRINSKRDLLWIDRNPRINNRSHGATQRGWIESSWRRHVERKRRRESGSSQQHAGYLRALVHLGGGAGRLACWLQGRARNIRSVGPGFTSRRRDINCGRYSSRCKYTKWEYVIEIESWCYVSRCGRFVAYRFRDDEGLHRGGLRSPHGYRWDIDDNGHLVLIRKRCGTEYHPFGHELTYGKAYLRKMVLESRQMRLRADRVAREARADEKRTEALKQGKWGLCLTYYDLRQSGACVAGIRSYCDRNGVTFSFLSQSVPYRLLARRRDSMSYIDRAAAIAYRRETLVMI